MFQAQYNLIPKGVLSLKVLQELPTIVVLMYELYKDKVLQEVNDYIPVIIKTITLQPLKQHRYAIIFASAEFKRFKSKHHLSELIFLLFSFPQESPFIQQRGFCGFHGRSDKNSIVPRVHHSRLPRSVR